MTDIDRAPELRRREGGAGMTGNQDNQAKNDRLDMLVGVYEYLLAKRKKRLEQAILRNDGGEKTMSEKLTPEELQANLNQFTGTQEYHRWSVLFPKIVLTDGALYLAEQAGAYWLMDAIGSHQINPKVRWEGFQVWILRVESDHQARLTCEDGNGKVITSQEIEYTDFTLPEVKLYAIPQEGVGLMILLPSEY